MGESWDCRQYFLKNSDSVDADQGNTTNQSFGDMGVWLDSKNRRMAIRLATLATSP